MISEIFNTVETSTKSTVLSAVFTIFSKCFTSYSKYHTLSLTLISNILFQASYLFLNLLKRPVYLTARDISSIFRYIDIFIIIFQVTVY